MVEPLKFLWLNGCGYPDFSVYASERQAKALDRAGRDQKNGCNWGGCNCELPVSQFGRARTRHDHRNGRRTPLGFQDE